MKVSEKMKTAKKPIFPILPSTLVAGEEVKEFVERGNTYFADETVFGNAVARIVSTPEPASQDDIVKIDTAKIRACSF